jgi:acyl-CoA thioester hydrolase
MEEFRFYQPIAVRYGDVDAHRHVNNASYFTYMEFARIEYIKHIGLWDGFEFDDIGMILLETTCTFKEPIRYGQKIRVGVKTVKLGTKSMEILNSVEDVETGTQAATGRSILVAYDYVNGESIAIPDQWRTTIQEFDGV